jgi:hypothetical protein
LRPEESSRAMQIQKLQVRPCCWLDCSLQDTTCLCGNQHASGQLAWGYLACICLSSSEDCSRFGHSRMGCRCCRMVPRMLHRSPLVQKPRQPWLGLR